MGRTRRTFTEKFKAGVAVEAVRGVKTVAGLLAQHPLGLTWSARKPERLTRNPNR